MISISHSHFIDFFNNLSDNTIDLILTDPPYAISRKTGFAELGKNSIKRFGVNMDFGSWDQTEIDISILSTQMYRTLKKGGTAIVFYDLWKITYLANAMIDVGFKMIRLIIWQKTNPVPLNSHRSYLTNSREVAVVGVKSGKPVFNSEYDNGIYFYPIFHSKTRMHPTQKPIELFVDLINKHSLPKQLVVDPFLGSGTTAEAALCAGRNFSGCDISKEYVKMAQTRVDGQLNL